MSRWRRTSGEDEDDPGFVEAGPGLFGRLLDIWHDESSGRWLRLIGFALAFPFRLIWAAVEAMFGFVRFLGSEGMHALQNRRLVHLLQGLPAFAAIVAFAVTASVAISGRGDLSGVYRRAGDAAFAEEQWKTAKLCYERLFRLDGGTADTRLLLGLTLEKMGAIGEAEGLIQGVAEGDAGGDPRANRWLAARLMAARETLRDPERLREAYRHLSRAERSLPDDAGVKLDLAKYYLAVGDTRKAIPKLAAAASSDPGLHFDLARLHLAVGERDAARTSMERAERHFRERLKLQPEDRQTRLLLANSVMNLGRLEETVAILREGTVNDPTGPYPQAIAKVYLAAYDRLAARTPRDYGAMINALREALRHDPKSVDAAVKLAGFGDPVSGSAGLAQPPDPLAEREAREMLEGLLATGEQPPAVHMALGLRSWRSQDLDAARWHFERAYELDPALSGVANNLAWVLAHQETPELERALAVIDPVIDRFPDVPHFLDTRGEIYTRMKRWEEALADFERALPGMRENPRLHESLAVVYTELGRSGIAERHRREAERLRSASTSAAETPTATDEGAAFASPAQQLP